MHDLRHAGLDDLRDDQRRPGRPQLSRSTPPAVPAASPAPADQAQDGVDPWAGLGAAPAIEPAGGPAQAMDVPDPGAENAPGAPDVLPPGERGNGGPSGPDAGGDVTAFRPEGEHFLRFVGEGWPLLRLYAINLVFIVLTLGVYSFWARTRVREYLWGRTLAFDEPLEYTGTGWQLCRSFLIVISLFFGLNIIMTLISLISLEASLTVSMLFMIVVVLFWPYAIYSALRFRLSRTNWRGVHGWLTGSPVEYAAQSWVRAMLIGATLGLFAPHATAFLTRFIVNNASLGTRKFRFEADVKALSHPYYVYWALCVVLFLAAVFALVAREEAFAYPHYYLEASDMGWLALLGLIGLVWLSGRFVYGVIRLNWTIRGIRFGEGALDSRLTISGYWWLMLSNTLLILITLGLAGPWTQVRRYRYLADRVLIRGSIRWSDIRQDDAALPKSGEGLLSVLDLDLGF